MSLSLTTVVSGFDYTSASIYAGLTTVEFEATYSGELFAFNTIWIFGDGSYEISTSPTTSHLYDRPGTYNVSLIVFSTVEEYRNYLVSHGQSLSALPSNTEYLTFTQSVSVVNYIQDSISFVNTPDGVLQSRAQSTPFRIEFFTTQNSTPVVQLYAEGSLSQPSVQIDPRWAHLKPQWRFLDIDGEIVDTITPESDNIKTLVVNNGSLSAAPFDSDIPSTLTAGISGYIEFYYVDDIPGNVTLHATIDTEDYQNPYDLELTEVPSYANSELSVTTSYTVSASTPAKLLITTSGLSAFALEGTKWQNVLVPYVITICDSEGFILRNYPLNNALGAAYEIDRQLIGIDSDGVTFEEDEAYFQRYDDNDLDVGGYYTGFFQSLSTISDTQLYATVTMHTSAGLLSLSGISGHFDILDHDANYDMRKFNEDFDMTDTIKSFALQESISRNSVLFDSLIGQIIGDSTSAPTTLGKRIYEKIANYVDNHADIDRCNIDKLYAICEELGVPIEDYNLAYPADLKRLMDILSISLSRLKGSREYFDRDFVRDVNVDSAVNLGNKLDTGTYQLTAGVNIVVQEKHTNAFELYHVVELDGETSYPLLSLSAFNFKTPLDTYYNFYSYTTEYTLTQLEGVINWDDDYTTLSESISSIDAWFGHSGTVEAIFDYQLCRGLELINN